LSDVKRIGVLTGGGDCPGLNAVIRAVTKSALRRGIEVMGIAEGFGGLITGQATYLGERDVSGILPRGGTILGTSNRDNPFKFPVGKNKHGIVYEDRSAVAIETIEKLGIDVLVVIGGDGSQTIGLELSRMGANVVGIPKTIDNDLMETDITFGFDSALHTATEAVDKLHSTAESHHRIMVLEVMGRNSGWIALEAGMAGGGDVVLIPEIPFEFVNVAGSIMQRRERGKRFSIVVVAEGARLPDGKLVSRTSPSGQTVLGGVGEVIARELEAVTGVESRITVLGHLQRGGSPTPFDRILATRFGVGAIELICSGEFGRMVCLKTPHISSVPLESAVTQQRRVQADGELVRFARAVGMCFGDEPA
jgi:ATP-dependent phosphofructokinase / diphosphate-dependent phosphofructokinase